MRLRLILCSLAALSLAACGDPIADFPRLADQQLAEDAATADAVAAPSEQAESLMERLSGGEGNTQEPAPHATEPATQERTGFFGWLNRDTASPKARTSQDDAVLDALPAEPDVVVDKAQPQRRGLLGGVMSSAPDQPTSEIAPGTVMPYGQVARICGLPKREFGKQIAQYPERNPIHFIYDSNPGNPGPHTFYITGFADGCARQFTASMAMFGPVALHEQLRYGLPAEVQPYSATDKAYEAVKARVCGVPRQKPCGSKVSRLDRNTVFVSIYERFGSNPHWTNLLIHEGDILAQDQKGS